MNGLFDMVVFDVGNHPNVTRIFAKRISGELSRTWPFEILLAGIICWHPYRVEVEGVIVRFCEPQDRLVAARKAPRTMQTVLKMPDDAISELESMFEEKWIERDVERND